MQQLKQLRNMEIMNYTAHSFITNLHSNPNKTYFSSYTDDHLVLYGCFGVEPEDGFCPEENEGIQLWGRRHQLNPTAMADARLVSWGFKKWICRLKVD